MTVANDKLIPGSNRNRPCLCGSGVKSKACPCDGSRCVTQYTFDDDKVTKRVRGAEVERFTRGAAGVYPGAWRSTKIVRVKARATDAASAELAKVGLRKVPTVPTGLCASRGPRKSKDGPLVGACTARHNEPPREELPCAASECQKKTLGRQVVLCWDVPACPEHNLHRDYKVEVKLYLNGRIGVIAHRKLEIVRA